MNDKLKIGDRVAIISNQGNRIKPWPLYTLGTVKGLRDDTTEVLFDDGKCPVIYTYRLALIGRDGKIFLDNLAKDKIDD
jgi:hypothetical protein